MTLSYLSRIERLGSSCGINVAVANDT